MACFSFNATQREMLINMLQVAYDGLIEDEQVGASIVEPIEALMAELEAGNGSIEITVMPIEQDNAVFSAPVRPW